MDDTYNGKVVPPLADPTYGGRIVPVIGDAGPGVTMNRPCVNGFTDGPDGAFRYYKDAIDTLVWRWDGRQWRRIRHGFPEHIRIATSIPIPTGAAVGWTWEPLNAAP